MKKYILLVASVWLVTFNLVAGEIEIPESIKKSFTQKFPTAHDIKWDGDSESHYEVGFVLDGKDKIAVFLPDGTFKEIETEIKVSEIPKRVLNSVNRKFPLSKIAFALKIQRSNNTTVYEVEVNTGIEEIDITLDSMGFEVD